jgi:protein required for attachment to host cells
MSEHWIVVAESTRARIFSVDPEDGQLHPVVTLEHPEGRKQAHEINADRPGRVFDIVGEGRHSMGTEIDPVEEDRLRFAKRVNEYLRAACLAGRCKRLLLVAGPHQLGLFRKHLELPPGTTLTELEKNLGHFEAQELRQHLPQRL